MVTAFNGATNRTTWPVNRVTVVNGTGATTGGANQTDPSWSSAATTTAKPAVTYSRGPATAAAGTTVTIATGATNWPSSGGGNDKTTATTFASGGSGSGRIATSSSSSTTTTTTTTTTTVHSTYVDGDNGIDAKPGNGGYDYGGGHRYPGGSDERDGEVMITTHNVAFGAENYPPAVKPTPPKHAEPPINTKAAESTAFVVLVTAATLIIIVLIILLVLKVKYRTDTNRYKIEMPKAYGAPMEPGSDRGGLCQQQQNANLLSPGNYPSSRQSSPTYMQNNNFRPHGAGNMMNNKPKKRQDVKEWYV